MQYKISFNQPNRHYIDIECNIENIALPHVEIQLPSWRPGRYELGNFAKNIQKFEVFNSKNEALSFKKITKDKWHINTNGDSVVKIVYTYYAAELNAGSTWLDENQLYVNPINCLLYFEQKIDEPCRLEIIVPSNYKIAGALNVLETISKENNKIIKAIANDYHCLVDTPFICSDSLQHNLFVLDGVEFNIWFQGECKPDWAKVIGDFFIFINEQFVLFKSFPTERYHFIIQVLPYQFYHGVEHADSTVIAIGPSYNLMRKELYDELLGVSSHELFHTWNVKNIRPKEMMPYKYNTENYATTGYIYEGITTYYGDLMLYRSGIFSDADYFRTLTQQIQKHLDNHGRFNYSVAQSSFDTWLDGYVPGVPNRKVSIYTEGCLLAFMADALIRKQTNNKASLDDVMLTLYNDFGKNKVGYTAHDYQTIIENVTGQNWNNFFFQLVDGVKPFNDLLTECLDYFGLELSIVASKKPYESFLGFKTTEQNNETIVQSIFPNSLAENAGLCVKDKIIGVNGFEVKNNLNEWCNYFWRESFTLNVITEGKTRQINLEPSKKMYYKTYWVMKSDSISAEQAENYNKWIGRKF
ncbi:MAG TPA: PDZ domain-containing protein [Bacteroidia bacterium]|nr:PDZ domain-containing protein [Bacteroidia bacterium]